MKEINELDNFPCGRNTEKFKNKTKMNYANYVRLKLYKFNFEAMYFSLCENKDR